MKLNYKRTILVGFAFFLISAFWQAYDATIPVILTNKFGMSQTWSGLIMAIDNILAVFMLPIFGSISDKCRSPKGKRTPLVGPEMNAPSVHGESGLDGPPLPEPTMELENCSSVNLMARLLKESEEPVTIVATGPLTNVAALLLSHPELKTKIREISFMGGGIQFGNWTPAAEFNILVDP